MRTIIVQYGTAKYCLVLLGTVLVAQTPQSGAWVHLIHISYDDDAVRIRFISVAPISIRKSSKTGALAIPESLG